MLHIVFVLSFFFLFSTLDVAHAFSLIYFGNEWMDEKKILHNIWCWVKKENEKGI
jgi:hypothetical protein